MRGSFLPDSTMFRLIAAAPLVLVLGACSPPPPEPEISAEPQRHTELRDAMQAPLDRARAVEDDVKAAADAQREAIDAQTD